MYIRGTESAQSDLLKYTSLNNLKTQPPPLLASQAINPLVPEVILQGTERPQLPTPTG